eukprot:m.24156 g.24156  ORF g.24156 m.24156 type:complete len:752 (-) comp7406_c0_seq1:68-2323(-)
MSAPKYFSDNKRSEVNELRGLLTNLEVQRDRVKYREAVQKVIMYMTLGVDVSRLFSEMIMASATNDMVQKKLVYLYLCNYAESHTDLTLLAVNTLQKNCRDSNPMIRGLALRSMCSLRVPNLVEYVLQPVQDGLRDKSPYVRKTAVLGCVKLFYIAENAVRDCGIPETLYSMTQDRDHLVAANCILALQEMLSSEGGIVLTKELVYAAFNRLKHFSDWSQCAIMSILERYVPDNEDEIFDILNILDERLKHSNSGVVMAAAKLFIKFTRSMPDVQADVFERVKVPLITLMSSKCAELCFTVMHHIQILLPKAPRLLDSEFKVFYCRYTEPNYVKFKKLEILQEIASPSNMEAIVEELAAYVADVDVDIARQSIQTLGRIAAKLPACADHIFSMLIAFLDIDASFSSFVTAETLIVMKDLLRRYPDRAMRVVAHLPTADDLDVLDEEPAARAALVFLLGEYGEHLDAAPYILETMIDDVAEEVSHVVRLQLLTAAVKLFFKRPPECQKMLGRLLCHEMDEELHTDVHDRAMLYYRLLQTNVEEARRVLGQPAQSVTDFVEHRGLEGDKIFTHFNTLSVIYGVPVDSPAIKTSEEQYELPPAPEPSAAAGGAAVGDLLGGSPAVTQVGRDPHMSLVPNPTLQPADFEQIWLANEVTATIKDLLNRIPSAAETERLLKVSGVIMMASSPPLLGVIKFFFYGQEADTQAFFLVEANMDLNQQLLQASFKSQNAERTPDFATLFRRALCVGGLIDM